MPAEMTISKEVLRSHTLGSLSAEGSQTLTLVGANMTHTPAEGVTPTLVGSIPMRTLEMPTTGIHMQGSHLSRERFTLGPLTTEEKRRLQAMAPATVHAMQFCPVLKNDSSCLMPVEKHISTSAC